MDKITTHSETALGYVLSQFEDSPRLRKLVEIIGDQIQLAENLAYSVWEQRFLDAATGVILDAFGKIVQVQRLGDSDDIYRRVIAGTIAANMSNTHGDTIAAVASALVGESVRYRWDGPMNIDLEYVTRSPISAAHAARAQTIIQRACGGAIQWRLTEGFDGSDIRDPEGALDPEEIDGIDNTLPLRYGDGPGLGRGSYGRIVCRSYAA